jgi:hypothetical protein
MELDLERCDEAVVRRVLREALADIPARDHVMAIPREFRETLVYVLQWFYDIREAELTETEAQGYFEAQRADYADFTNTRRVEDALLEKP